MKWGVCLSWIAASLVLGGERSAAAAPATMEGWVRLILEEPEEEVQAVLRRDYLGSLDAEDVGAFYRVYGEMDGQQVSRVLCEILEQWAAKDPAGCWEKVRVLLSLGMSDHFVDEWSERVVGPEDVEGLSREPWWPDIEELQAFLDGLERSHAGEETKATIGAAFEEAFERRTGWVARRNWRWGWEDFQMRVENRDSPDRRMRVLRAVLDSPVDELRPALEDAVWVGHWPAVVYGLRRWVKEVEGGEPKALAYAEGLEEGVWGWSKVGGGASLFGNVVLKAWAKRDGEGMGAWLRVHRPSIPEQEIREYLVPWATQEEQKKWILQDDGSVDLGLMRSWSQVEAGRALGFLEQLEGDREKTLEAVLEPLSYIHMTVENRREVIDFVVNHGVDVPGLGLTWLMENWGEIDVGQAARYGVTWMLGAGAFQRDWVLSVWRGENDPVDGSPDDRTYGCLRKWAVCEPAEMKRWIDGLADAEVREALTWLWANAEGAEAE